MNTLIFLPDYKSKDIKALQLYIKDTPHLVICNGNRYHHQSLQELLKREQIPFDSKSFGRRGRGPKQKGNQYQLVGAGYAIINPHKIHLHNESEGYRIGINKEHAEKINELITDREITFKIW